jgi:hypothetical protein
MQGYLSAYTASNSSVIEKLEASPASYEYLNMDIHLLLNQARPAFQNPVPSRSNNGAAAGDSGGRHGHSTHSHSSDPRNVTNPNHQRQALDHRAPVPTMVLTRYQEQQLPAIAPLPVLSLLQRRQHYTNVTNATPAITTLQIFESMYMHVI